MTIKISVERIEFDAEQCMLRLNGTNVEENEHVKLGQYHTLDISIGHPVTIEKDCWVSCKY
jgi:protein pelota